MFSEEVVRYWGSNDRAPYRDLGRPTLWTGGDFATVDFLLEARADGRRFVAEQKAEMAWSSYRYLRLVEPSQVARHGVKRAFAWLLDLARDPTSHIVNVKTRPIDIYGAILIWGAITPDGRVAAMETFGFADVLSLEAMISDLREWDDPAWRARVEELHAWADGLFDGLI